MRKAHIVIIGLLGVGAIVGVAEAGDRGARNHASAIDQPANAGDWRLYTGKRDLSNDTPYYDPNAPVSHDPTFHRERPLDPANPWQPGVITPSLPAITKGIDQKL